MRTQRFIKDYKLGLSINLKILVGSYVILYFLAIFQDYIFSQIKFTGFYWSDTMLYNIYWLLFIPFIQFANHTYKKVQPERIVYKIFYALTSGFFITTLHVIFFTTIFILGSNIIFPVPHRFSTIFKNAISNQSQITLITYLISPFIFEYFKRKKHHQKPPPIQKSITVKNGTRRIKVEISTILFIKSDKPYTAVFSENQKFLHDESLKKLEKILDPQIFIRVHRSVIINKNQITELRSRKNGDYDGILINGEFVRLSRHYRQNWNVLLHH